MSDADATTPAALGRLSSTVQQHQSLAFVLLTIGLSWSLWGGVFLGSGGGSLSTGFLIPGAFGPLLAAAIVTWVSGGRLRTWAAQVTRWRVAPRWYLIAVGVPAVTALGGVGGALLVAGGSLEPSVLSGRLPVFAFTLLFALVGGGGQEEFGWRGFLLPRLQATYSALTASLLVGLVWAVWHLPLFLMDAPRNETGSFLLYAALVLGLSIIMTWCYNGTGGSVLLAMLLHAGFNASGTLLPVTTDVVAQWPLAIDVGMVAGVWVVALAVVVRGGTQTLSRCEVPDATVTGAEAPYRTTSNPPQTQG